MRILECFIVYLNDVFNGEFQAVKIVIYFLDFKYPNFDTHIVENIKINKIFKMPRSIVIFDKTI